MLSVSHRIGLCRVKGSSLAPGGPGEPDRLGWSFRPGSIDANILPKEGLSRGDTAHQQPDAQARMDWVVRADTRQRREMTILLEAMAVRRPYAAPSLQRACLWQQPMAVPMGWGKAKGCARWARRRDSVPDA